MESPFLCLHLICGKNKFVAEQFQFCRLLFQEGAPGEPVQEGFAQIRPDKNEKTQQYPVSSHHGVGKEKCPAGQSDIVKTLHTREQHGWPVNKQHDRQKEYKKAGIAYHGIKNRCGRSSSRHFLFGQYEKHHQWSTLGCRRQSTAEFP